MERFSTELARPGSESRPLQMNKEPQLGWWFSFADANKPKGQMFVGIAIVGAEDPNAGMARCIELGIWPSHVAGLDIEILPVDLNEYDAADMDKMLSRADAERLGNQVTITKKVPRGQSS